MTSRAAAVVADRKSDARPKEASQVFQSRIMSGHGLYRRLANRGRDKIAPAPGIYARHKFALYMSVHGKCDDPIARRSRRSVHEMLPRPVFYRSHSLFGVRVRSGVGAGRERRLPMPRRRRTARAGPRCICTLILVYGVSPRNTFQSSELADLVTYRMPPSRFHPQIQDRDCYRVFN